MSETAIMTTAAPATVERDSLPVKSISRITLSSLTPNNLGTVRKLNASLFPIRYSETFYHNILEPEAEEYCQLAYFKDIPVGVICCRIEKTDEKPGEAKLYCMTMGVLSAYRHRGVASTLLRHVLDWAYTQNNAPPPPAPPSKPVQSSKPSKGSKGHNPAKQPAAPPPKPVKPKYTHIYLHVQTSNDGGKAFYEHHGFKEVGVQEGYYKKIEPKSAWILEFDMSRYVPKAEGGE